VQEVDVGEGKKGVEARVTVDVENPVPLGFTIPPMDFDVLVPACTEEDPRILLGKAEVEEIKLEPHYNMTVNAVGTVRELPQSLIDECPHIGASPLDQFVGRYMHRQNATVYVRGSQTPNPETPEWISNILSQITLPIPVQGRRETGELIKNFTFSDVKFDLPNPLADPSSPESSPRVSGNIVVLVDMPKDIHVDVDIFSLRTIADVFYKGKALGILNMEHWQKSKSKRVDADDGTSSVLKLQAKLKEIPLEITDQDVFSDMVEELLFGDGSVVLDIKALVDAKVKTGLGEVIIRGLPGYVSPFLSIVGLKLTCL
jgi:hypothetical protein